jgi:cytochrome P450
MFRSASNFTSPDTFIPERFLAESPFPDDRLHAFLPFLLGRHKCLGQKLAWAIMRLTLARLLYSFDLKMMEEARDFGDQKTYIFWDKKRLNIELQLRS